VGQSGRRFGSLITNSDRLARYGLNGVQHHHRQNHWLVMAEEGPGTLVCRTH
jgi:hypothetical protein